MKKSEELYQEFCEKINTKKINLKKIDTTRITLKTKIEEDDLNLKTLNKLENDPNLRVGLIKSYDCTAFVLNSSTKKYYRGKKITNKEIRDYLKNCESPELEYRLDPLWERISSKLAESDDITILIGEDLKKEDIPNLFLKDIIFDSLTDVTESFLKYLKLGDLNDENDLNEYIIWTLEMPLIDQGDVIGINFNDNNLISLITTESCLYDDFQEDLQSLQFFTIKQ